MQPDAKSVPILDDDAFDPIDVALRVARAVEACEGAYLVGSGVEAGRDEPHGSVVGIVLDLPIGRVQKFVSELGPEFEVGSEKLLRDALLLGGRRRILFVPAAVEIDLCGVGRTPYDEVEFARRRRVTVRPSGETLVVRSAEDTVLGKLMGLMSRGLVSDHDWSDVVQVLCVGGASLDYEHLEQWATRLGVAEMLEQARSESAATHVVR